LSTALVDTSQQGRTLFNDDGGGTRRFHMERWDEVEGFLVGEAEMDLKEAGAVRPCLVGFRGDRGIVLAWLRAFEKGAYHAAFIELIALAMPLGVDRLAVSLGGRAWSLADPVPPVVDGVGDLRQRVLVVHQVDGHRRRAHPTTRIHPFSLADGEIEWSEPLDPGPPEGWIPGVLEVAIVRRRALEADARTIREQAERCAALGHVLAFGPQVSERLGLGTSRPTGA
jgi:hypothetical protein